MAAVVLASENRQEIHAVAHAFQVSPRRIQACGVVPDQTALDLWKNVSAFQTNKTMLVIAIKSEVLPVQDRPRSMQERAEIVMGYPTTDPVHVHSDPVYFPKLLQDMAEDMEENIDTVMNQLFRFKSNWHEYFDKSKRSRVQILSEAIRKAHKQLPVVYPISNQANSSCGIRALMSRLLLFLRIGC